MRERRSDRFIILPFNVSCVSQASVSVSESKPKKQTLPKCRENTGKTPFQKPNISKLIKSFKSSLSHLIENLYKEDQPQEEEAEREMVIGYPTDVKHITHVGLDGLNNSTRQNDLPEFLSLKCVSSLSLGQFEKSMGAQAETEQV